MLKISKPKITYKLLSEDQILLQGVKDFDGQRINVVMRQMTPEDLDAYELIQSDLKKEKITGKEADNRSVSKLIVKWGDRESLSSLEMNNIPLETRGVLMETFQSFCLPTVELVEESDEG